MICAARFSLFLTTKRRVRQMKSAPCAETRGRALPGSAATARRV
jgi:hypothetical protein